MPIKFDKTKIANPGTVSIGHKQILDALAAKHSRKIRAQLEVIIEDAGKAEGITLDSLAEVC